MFNISKTQYGYQVTGTVNIDGIMLINSQIPNFYNINSESDVTSSYTIILDEEASGNIVNSTCNIIITDSSNINYNVYAIIFYTVVNGVKKCIAGVSSPSAIITKDSSPLNICLQFDFSPFTDGFQLSLIKATPSVASYNTDGVVHIENASTTSDDAYSVYSKQQIDNLLDSLISSGEIESAYMTLGTDQNVTCEKTFIHANDIKTASLSYNGLSTYNEIGSIGYTTTVSGSRITVGDSGAYIENSMQRSNGHTNILSLYSFGKDSDTSFSYVDLMPNSVSVTVCTDYSDQVQVLTCSYSEISTRAKFTPFPSNTHSLGDYQFRWKDLYVSGGNNTYYFEIGNDLSKYPIPADPVIRPNVTGHGELGTSSHHLSKAYIDDIFCNNITSSSGADIFCVCDISGSNVVHSLTLANDYRPTKPSGIYSLDSNPRWYDSPVSLVINQYFDFSSTKRISVYVPESTYVGSIAFYSSSNTSSSYNAYPVHFRGDESYHNAAVPAGSVLRMTYYQDAFYTDFYDLADFGVDHEPVVRVGTLEHERPSNDYNGCLVAVRADDGKLDRLLTVHNDMSCAGSAFIDESLLDVAVGSPIYVSFKGTCFSSHPRVPFGFITNVDYVYSHLDGFYNSQHLPFYYVVNGTVVEDTIVIEQHFVINSCNQYKYFHIDNAPVYLNIRGTDSKLIYIGSAPTYAAADCILIGFLCSGAENAGLLRLVQCGLYNSKDSNRVSVLGTSSSGNKPLIFTDTVNSTYNTVSKQLFTNTANLLYYNPFTNVLTCSNINGSANSLAYINTSTGSKTPLLTVTSSSAISVNSSSVNLGSTEIGDHFNSISTSSLNASTINDIKYGEPIITVEYGPSQTPNFIATHRIAPARAPSSSNTYSLGSSSRPFNTIYSSGFIGKFPHGTCSTTSSSAAKVVTCSPAITSSDLADGLIISIHFSNANTASNPTLNVNSTGALPLRQVHNVAMGSTVETSWSKDEEVLLIYYSSGYWCRLGRPTYPTSTASGTTNIIPSTDSSYSLGSTSYKWKDIYASNAAGSYYIEIGSSSVDNISEPTIRPSQNNYGYIGTSSYHFYRGYINNLYGVFHSLCGDSSGAIYFFKLIIKNNSTSSITVPRGTALNNSAYFGTSLLQITSWEERVDDTSQSYGVTTFSGTYYTMLRFTVSANATSASVYVPCLRTA